MALQRPAEGRLILRTENPGQHGAQPCVFGVFVQIHLIQQGQGQIQQLHAPGQFRCQLMGIGNRRGQGGGTVIAFRKRRQNRGGEGAPLRWLHKERPKLFQRVPPQGVDAAGGEHKSILQGNINLVAHESRAAGFFQAGAELFFRERAVSGCFRHGTRHGNAPPVPQCGGEPRRLARGYAAGKGHRQRAIFGVILIGFPHLGKPLFRPAGVLRAYAEHLGASLAQPVALSKPGTGKSAFELGLFGPVRGTLFIQQTAIDPRHRGHILRPLHAAL